MEKSFRSCAVIIFGVLFTSCLLPAFVLADTPNALGANSMLKRPNSSGAPSAQNTGPLGFGLAEFKREMQTDRPDFTEGTLTVEAGHIQVESGYTFIKNNDGNQQLETHSLPEVLLRVGVAEETELRFFWQGYERSELETESESQLGMLSRGTERTEGVSDFSLGFKHTMGYQDGLIPEHGLIAELGLPVGSSELTSDQVQPLLKFLWSYELSDSLGLAGNFNFDFPVLDDQRYLELSNSLSLAYGLSDELGVYFEYFGFYPDDVDLGTTSTHYANGGFTFLLNSNVQLDLRAGFGLNEAADDLFSGVGFTFRL